MSDTVEPRFLAYKFRAFQEPKHLRSSINHSFHLNMASSFLHPLALCLVLLSGCCLASRQSSPQIGQGECDIQNLNPIEAGNRIQHEAGYTEVWDENDQQLKCAGVAVTRHVIQNKGLLVPSFNNAPSMVFVIEGRGLLGVVFPGCPETFQSFQQSQQGQGRGQGSQGQDPSFRDRHQKIQYLRKGDAFVVPTGFVHWAYNEGKEELVLLVIHDISNRENQLDQNLRRFFLGGNQQGQQGAEQQGQQQSFGVNIFQHLNTEAFAQASGVQQEVIRKLQNAEGFKGFIVKVREGLKVVRPTGSEEQRGQEGTSPEDNGYEETLCTVRLKENLMNPERADIYTARGGSISTLNSFTLPILRKFRLSAGRGQLRQNAIISPYWNVDSHSISYVTRGSGRLQITGHSRRAGYEGEIHRGQLFIVPQNSVTIKQAGQQGLEWVTMKTNDNAKSNPLVGRTGTFRGVPLDVWINANHLTQEEARALKYNREEVTILDPQFSSEQQQQEGSPWSIV